MPPSIKHLNRVYPQEVVIALDGPPAFVRMMVENGQANFLQRTFFGRRSPGVINDPVGRAFGVSNGLCDKNHCVIGKLLNPRLMEEKQIALLGVAPVAADEDAIEI